MVVKPERADAETSFRRVKSLRNTNDFALSAKACCTSNQELVKRLSSSTMTPLKDASVLESQKAALRGYTESAEALIGRIRNATDLVSIKGALTELVGLGRG